MAQDGECTVGGFFKGVRNQARLASKCGRDAAHFHNMATQHDITASVLKNCRSKGCTAFCVKGVCQGKTSPYIDQGFCEQYCAGAELEDSDQKALATCLGKTITEFGVTQIREEQKRADRAIERKRIREAHKAQARVAGREKRGARLTVEGFNKRWDAFNGKYKRYRLGQSVHDRLLAGNVRLACRMAQSAQKSLQARNLDYLNELDALLEYVGDSKTLASRKNMILRARLYLSNIDFTRLKDYCGSAALAPVTPKSIKDQATETDSIVQAEIPTQTAITELRASGIPNAEFEALLANLMVDESRKEEPKN